MGNLGKISDSSFYDDNTLYVVGEVKNTGDVAIQNTNVKVIFYDDLNQKINTSTGYTDLNVILVGRKSFFNIRLLESEGASNIKNYTIWFNWTDTSAGKPEGLVILSSNENIDSDGHKHITGQIQNQGILNSNNTEVSATFYNSTGTVIATAWSFSTPTHLAPNQIADFDIELTYTQQVTKIASYSLNAESNNLALSTTPISSTSPSSSPTISTSTSPSPTPDSSTSPTASSTTSSNPITTPQNTPEPTTSPSSSTSPTTTSQITNHSSQSTSPTETPTADPQTPLITAIAVVIILVIAGIFVIYWSKKRRITNKSSQNRKM